jgi:hypothetical protein
LPLTTRATLEAHSKQQPLLQQQPQRPSIPTPQQPFGIVVTIVRSVAFHHFTNNMVVLWDAR